MDIKGLVSVLCKKYDTRDPFEIARQKKIIVQFEPLGGIYGYYSKSFKQQFIHINQNLSRPDTTFTACHELAHTIIHPNLSTPFLRGNTIFSVSKLETQANQFAVNLMFTDYELQEFLELSYAEAAAYMGVSIPLAKYRMQTVEPMLFGEE